MIYFLYVYFLGAVYDRQIYGKVKFAVLSCLLMREMEMARFAAGEFPEKGGTAREAWDYSGEMEHSDRNLEGMERILMESSLFRLADFLYA